MNSNIWPIGIWIAGTLIGLLGSRWASERVRRICLPIIAAQAIAMVAIFAFVGFVVVVGL